MNPNSTNSESTTNAIALSALPDFFANIQNLAAGARLLADALDSNQQIDPGDFDLAVSFECWQT